VNTTTMRRRSRPVIRPFDPGVSWDDVSWDVVHASARMVYVYDTSVTAHVRRVAYLVGEQREEGYNGRVAVWRAGAPQ